MRSQWNRLPLSADQLGSALLLAIVVGLTAFALAPELSGAPLTAYLVAAPVVAIVFIVAWRREHTARRRQHKDTWALLHANLQLREQAQALLQEARHDPLTGIDNRRSWNEKLDREGQRAARYGGDPAVIMLDLDRFKAVNDLLGHPAGDTVLIDLTNVLLASLRSSDTLARLGGDEFGVLLPDGGAHATAVAEKLRSGIEQEALGVTVSVGVATGASPQRPPSASPDMPPSASPDMPPSASPDMPPSASPDMPPGASPDMQNLVRAADAALYDAKAAGRNRVVVATGAGPELRHAA